LEIILGSEKRKEGVATEALRLSIRGRRVCVISNRRSTIWAFVKDMFDREPENPIATGRKCVARLLPWSVNDVIPSIHDRRPR
jgi:hypothetical protein